MRYFKSLRRRVFKSGPNGDALQLKDVDFGTVFLNECSKYEYGKGEFERNKVIDLKNRCWAFMLKLVEETEKRIPNNLEVFEKVKAFKPDSVISGSVNFSNLQLLGSCDDEELPVLENQWRQLSQVEWAETKMFKDKPLPKDPVMFWSSVREYKGTSVGDDEDLNNNRIFLEVSDFVLGKLTIAHSTAAVERTFSILSCVKTKLRNRMKSSTVEAVIRIRTYLYNRDKCCKSISVSDEMLKLFTSKIYSSSDKDSCKDTEEQDFNNVIELIPPM